MENFKFEHDSLVCRVGKPVLYSEKHGEDDVNCVAIPLSVIGGEMAAKVAASVWCADATHAAEALHNLSTPLMDMVTLNCEVEEHRVNFRSGSKKLATLDHAKLNRMKYKLDNNGTDATMTIRVQAPCSPEVFGVLVGLWRKQLRIETKYMGEEPTAPEEQQ